METNYIVFFSVNCIYEHIEILLGYLRYKFPEQPFSMINEKTLFIGDYSIYQHIPVRFIKSSTDGYESAGTGENCEIIPYILNFVNGDMNDIFEMKDYISDYGLYYVEFIS
jgi:hypothetical protein